MRSMRATFVRRGTWHERHSRALRARYFNRDLATLSLPGIVFPRDTRIFQGDYFVEFSRRRRANAARRSRRVSPIIITVIISPV